MVSESFLWLSGSCGHLRRSSAALAFIQLSLSEASHRRHTHSTCNTWISTFCAFNCQRTGIERQNSQSQAKPNQERLETASHAPPRAVWSFCLTSTRRLYLPRAPTRQSTLTHTPAATSFPATLALGDVTLPRQHTSSVDRWLWPLTLIVDRWLWPSSKFFNRTCFAQFFS